MADYLAERLAAWSAAYSVEMMADVKAGCSDYTTAVHWVDYLAGRLVLQ